MKLLKTVKIYKNEVVLQFSHIYEIDSRIKPGLRKI
jgi:hypothetical protein